MLLDNLEQNIRLYGYDINQPKIEEYAVSKSTDIRIELAVLLCNYINSHSENILIKLLYDKSISVRTEAADSLGSFKNERVYRELMDCYKGAVNTIFKGYLLISIGDVCQEKNKEETKNFIYSILINEKKAFVRIQAYSALFILGERRVLDNILNMYFKCGYRNKCVILNTLISFHEDNLISFDDVSNFVQKIKNTINCTAIQSTYDNLIDCLMRQ